jgi:hypothetical protein
MMIFVCAGAAAPSIAVPPVPDRLPMLTPLPFRSSAPPLIVTAWPVGSAPAEPSCSVPAKMVVPPV